MPKKGGAFNSALMELGATVCLPGLPACERCPVRTFCRVEDPATLPVKEGRKRTVHVEEPCLFVRSKGRILLRRETGKRWHGMLKLPPCVNVPKREPLWTTVYPLTHHRIRLSVYPGTVRPKIAGGEWIPVERLDSVPIIAAHRRAVGALLRGANASGRSI
jgi:A/G-specific adenine glycosylase